MVAKKKAFGSLVKHLRGLSGNKPSQFAKQVGVTRETLRDWERGKALPTLSDLQRMYEELELDAREYLVFPGFTAKCRKPDCNRAAVSRGLCRSDYQAAYEMVSAGTVSWGDLEALRHVDPPRRTTKEWLLDGVETLRHDS